MISHRINGSPIMTEPYPTPEEYAALQAWRERKFCANGHEWVRPYQEIGRPPFATRCVRCGKYKE
jgi:hypothetical protein